MEGKKKKQIANKKITIVAVISFILVLAALWGIFLNNGTIKTQNAKKIGVQRAGEDITGDGSSSNEGSAIESGIENYKATVIEETETTDGKKKFTITNKYNGPVITAEKTVEVIEKNETAGTETKRPYEGYVVEGTELEYTITAINNGEVEKTNLLVKDTIPEGLEFVAGSVKVNGSSTYGETDLTRKNTSRFTKWYISKCTS